MTALRLTANERKIIEFIRSGGASSQIFSNVVLGMVPKEKEFYSKAEIAAGGGFPCEVDPKNCDKRTRTRAHAQSHNLPEGHRAN